MNIAFYGHAGSSILMYTHDGIFDELAMKNGVQFIYEAVVSAIEDGKFGRMGSDCNTSDDEYRRDYYALHNFAPGKKGGSYMVSRKLGYKKGRTENDIFYVPPENPNEPTDIMIVYDEGYGGLVLPGDAECVLWSSNHSLPDKEQFAKIADKCFLFLDADVLRKAGARISRQISWERTVSELIQEIQYNPAINYLLDAKHILIAFETDGGVYFLTDKRQFEASLILTHGSAEGFIKEKSPGVFAAAFPTMVSLFAQLIVILPKMSDESILKEVKSQSKNVISNCIMLMDANSVAMNATAPHADITGRGLRRLLEAGEAVALFNFSFNKTDIGEENYDNVAHGKFSEWEPFSIPIERDKSGKLYVPSDWTVAGSEGNKDSYEVAFNYVKNGAAVIEGLPHLSFGALNTVDRWEIEAYQNIRNLILDYATSDTTRPLSIAVFGSPGSGKSFGVTQIAENILPGKVRKLEFNVSQFLTPLDLGVAFQKVRDVILEGKLPLVFFDEFDSDKDGMPLGWVKSFLMPMQDGRFRDESGEHPLGRCILVFAGGTAPNFGTFIAPMSSEDKDILQNFKNIKGPDFVSRLKGTINVLGPNPKDALDKNHVLRRALLLRSLCERDRRLNMADGIAPVSPAIIKAMLLVPEFNHGARSMEAILAMSRVDGGSWEPASLPFHSQLELHCDADAFLELAK